MAAQHIVSSFDQDLEGVQMRLMRMAGLVETAITDALRALETRDLSLSEKVRTGDRAIDAMDAAIKEETARILALRAPAARDLRMVLAVMAMSTHLERCGDYAKNIAKRHAALADAAPIEHSVLALRRMGRIVVSMLSDALDATIRKDADLAEAARARDLDVDQDYNALFRSLLTYMMENPRNITTCMHLHFIAKNIERMGDHATSVAEQVIYLIRGERPDEDRPKGDTTPFVAPEG
ncbi:phosphate signaling complex protein PhoU [Roseibaca sp. Y0-43]|uniref:phosphate signaling complex protein PhoU n=1 Tax=Roseibaca sp. Y0-43 TaxID=2816854 RepID=UPI001D0C0153|nr:phosphate signaling complex protein PhoU [Roseibaca sp. Y0-43]MCC1480977.1 phosphate signaling complex protein PhoU [Roseibaca sp. Y0-43]